MISATLRNSLCAGAFLLLSSFPIVLNAQVAKFQRVLGGVDSTQDGLDIKQTNDGGYIINARITLAKTAPFNNAPQEDAYILKVTSAGTLQWSKRHAGTSYEEGRGIVQTTDGGYYYAGETRTWSAGGPMDFDAFCTKTDAAGNIQWTRNFGDVWNDGAWTCEQTVDGGYMAFGSSSNLATNGYSDYYLLKLSNAGNIQWTRTFGGSHFDFGYDAMQTSDAGYIMTGGSFSFGNGYSFYTIKCDVNGNYQWGTALNEFADEYAYGIDQTNDGGYIVTGGYTGFGLGSTDVLLVKMTSTGSVSWVKNYGGFQHECGFTVRQTSDGGYAVAGSTNSVGNGGNDLFLMKTDAAGTIQWTKTYGGTGDEAFPTGMFFSYSGVNGDVAMVITNDGGFALTSQTNSYGNGHVYLVKTDANGNSDCNETNGPFFQGVPTMTVISSGTQTNPTQLTGGPNPVVTTPFSLDSNVCCTTPTAMAGSDVTICQSASTTLSASGGSSYSWSSGQSTSSISVSPINTTTYIVTVSDTCGSDKDTVIVTVNPLPTSNAGPDITICPGAMLMLNGSGSGTTYAWNPGGQTTSSITVSPTVTTTYTFTVSNSCGSASDSVKAVVSNSILASVAGNLTLCPGGSTTLTASGGSGYTWSTGASTNPIVVSPSTTTSYSVIAVSGSCSDTLPFTVTVGPAPSAAISASATSVCFGQSATLSASGGNNYSWNTGQTSSSISVSPSVTTSYTVIADNGGCTDTATVQLIVTPSIIFNVSPTTVCAGNSATISAAGGGTYLWNTGETTSAIIVAPTTTSGYTVQVTSGVCTGTAVATVNVSTPFTASIGGNMTVCQGSSGTITASGGGTYAWNTGQTTASIVIAPTGATSYSVLVNNGACSSTATVSIGIAPPVNINAPGSIICSGSSTTITPNISGGTAPYSYSWSTGATTSSLSASPTSTSSYSITVTDALGCSSTFAAQITVLAAPVIGITGNTSICIGSAATLTANGGVTYSWSTGVTTTSLVLSPTSSSSYTVTGSDGNGCSKTVTVSITVSQPPVVAVAGNTTACAGQPLVLTASGGGTYLWNTGQTSSSITVSPSASTGYSVTVNLGGCTGAASHSVTVLLSPVANAGSSVSIGAGDEATLTAGGGGSYLWSNGMTDQSITVKPSATTPYCVTVLSANGCTDTACVIVYVEPLDCDQLGPLYLPNAFSPNGDNDNDRLKIYYNVDCIETLKIILYDRWGEKVFESTDPLFNWDGIYKSKELTSGVYSYYLEVTYVNQSSGVAADIRKGNISLMR